MLDSIPYLLLHNMYKLFLNHKIVLLYDGFLMEMANIKYQMLIMLDLNEELKLLLNLKIKIDNFLDKDKCKV